MNLRVWVSMKARRTIMKKGSFDNYILRTKPEQLDSKFGLLIRGLIKRKMKDPQFKIPLIAGHYTQAKSSRAAKYWGQSMPAVYMPQTAAALREDRTLLYVKTPQEMSRYEIAELEKEIRDMNEANPEEETEVSKEEMMKDPTYQLIVTKMEALMKMRHATIKRYFEKNKYKRINRNEIV